MIRILRFDKGDWHMPLPPSHISISTDICIHIDHLIRRCGISEINHDGNFSFWYMNNWKNGNKLRVIVNISTSTKYFTSNSTKWCHWSQSKRKPSKNLILIQSFLINTYFRHIQSDQFNLLYWAKLLKKF